MKSPIWILILLFVGAACVFGGYKYGQTLSKATSSPTVTIDEADSVVERIVGQGNLQPANGTVNIMAPPGCLLYTSPSPRDRQKSRMPSSA